MKILAALRREERKLAKAVAKLRRQLAALQAAAKALGSSAGRELDTAEKRVLSAATRTRISAAGNSRRRKQRARSKQSFKSQQNRPS